MIALLMMEPGVWYPTHDPMSGPRRAPEGYVSEFRDEPNAYDRRGVTRYVRAVPPGHAEPPKRLEYGCCVAREQDERTEMPEDVKLELDLRMARQLAAIEGREVSRRYQWLPSKQRTDDPLGQAAYGVVKVIVELDRR